MLSTSSMVFIAHSFFIESLYYNHVCSYHFDPQPQNCKQVIAIKVALLFFSMTSLIIDILEMVLVKSSYPKKAIKH